MRTCARCKSFIPESRLEILPDTQTCVSCSGVQKYVGAMVYDHIIWNLVKPKFEKL